MAETVQGQNQPVTQPAAQQPQGQVDATQAGTEPKWLSYVPEAEREDAKRGWLQQSDYTKKTQELSEQRKNWEQQQQEYQKLKSWYDGSYAPFWTQWGEKLTQNWDKVQPLLTGQQQAALQQLQQQPPQANNAWEARFQNFDVLPAQDQAKLIADYVVNERVNQGLTALEQKMQQAYNEQFQRAVAYFNNYLDIMNDAYEQRFQDPGFPMKDYLQKRLEIQYGQANPRDIALAAVTQEPRLKKLQEEWMQKGREEAELKARNQQQSPGALQNQSVTAMRGTAMTREQVRDAVRSQATKAGVPWGNGFTG